MPFISVASDVNLFYEIHLSSSPQQATRPWLLILHPLFLDISFVYSYVNGPGQLLERFNIILIDFRSHGRTEAKASPSCDLWTLTADLAFALHKLNLPPVHLFATDALGSEVAFRLCGLFAPLVLSVCLCTVPPSEEVGFVKTAFQAVMTSWTNPDLPEDWDASVSATQWWLYGPRSTYCSLDVLDAWAGALIRRYPPCKATHALGSCIAYVERESPPSSLAPLIKVPMLALHGDFQNIYDCPAAERRFREFVNIPPTSSFRIMEDTPLQMFDTFPKRVKEQYYPWIDNLLALPTNPNPPRFATKKQAFNLQESLERFAHLLGDPSVALRDPDTSDSFHALSDDKISTNAELIQTLETNQIYKFSIAGGGAPESWTGASFEEQNPERFSRRIQKTAGEGGTNMVEEIILAITESTAEEDLI
ncbi:hypothetical protein PCANC_26669 [Puccinia coronata f. sp. avenae]|uniref:AB hydrolase-1 domain-containing protein n=1 Tax=Puccinia coronata f. sp. avenae TaxID=200324 RepID=A0A2N5TYG1_9BASI|nr:hypothetical protein PCANC_26669 [Puccinia coronata f. sp. avenae]PLW30529.1 hypothetical protein PCASD_22073 [Puccinia coronata f. sp. avenae]